MGDESWGAVAGPPVRAAPRAPSSVTPAPTGTSTPPPSPPSSPTSASAGPTFSRPSLRPHCGLPPLRFSCNQILANQRGGSGGLGTLAPSSWANCGWELDPVGKHRKHEWEKHGCCAGSVPALATELAYFTRSLALNTAFNITQSPDSFLPLAEPTECGLEVAVLGWHHPLALRHLPPRRLPGRRERRRRRPRPPPLHQPPRTALPCPPPSSDPPVVLQSDWYIVSIRLCLDKTLTAIPCPEEEQLTIRRLQGRVPPMEPCPTVTHSSHN